MTWTRRLAISNNSLKVLTLKAMESNTLVENCLISDSYFLVPRVLRLLGQRVVASRDSEVKPRLHVRFFACDGGAIFLKIVASPARGENLMCSHPRTGDATDEKIAEKTREKFNELNFLRLNHGLRQRVATQAIFAAR